MKHVPVIVLYHNVLTKQIYIATRQTLSNVYVNRIFFGQHHPINAVTKKIKYKIRIGIGINKYKQKVKETKEHRSGVKK